MSLKSLTGVSLDTITPSRETAQRLIAAVARQITDAKIKAVSSETRFCSAYTAIRMLADLGLHAHGYRALTSRPGHHYTAIQTLPLTFGVDARTVVRLDYLRKQRNVTEYSGDLVSDADVAECVMQAEAPYVLALRWLRKNKKDLL
jgi:hypothetical protein